MLPRRARLLRSQNLQNKKKHWSPEAWKTPQPPPRVPETLPFRPLNLSRWSLSGSAGVAKRIQFLEMLLKPMVLGTVSHSKNKTKKTTKKKSEFKTNGCCYFFAFQPTTLPATAALLKHKKMTRQDHHFLRPSARARSSQTHI